MFRGQSYTCLWLAVFLSLALPAFSGAPWFVRTWQSDQGLPDNSVMGIDQTPDGFLWVATQTGVARFDGLQFREYPLTTPGIASQTIQAFCVDRCGRVWVAWEQGIVVCLEQGRTTVMLSPDNPPLLRRARLMMEDGEGAVWVSYLDGTLVRFKEGQVRFYTAEDGLPAHGVTKLTVDRSGQLWFLNAQQVGVFREGRFLPLGKVTFDLITAAKDGGVWLCSNTAVARYTEANGLEEQKKLNTEISHLGLYSFLEGRSGGFWIGTRLLGLFYFDGARLDKIDTANQTILCMHEGREGNLWVGTRGGGMKQLNMRVAELLTTGDSARFGGIQSLCKDTTGKLWAINWNKGTVLRNRDQEWIPLSVDEGWKMGSAKCVAPDPQGGIWIGTQRNGLSLWRDGMIIRTLSTTNGLDENYVTAIRVTSSGAVWIGGGQHKSYLQCWENGTVQTFKLPPSSGVVTAIEVDASGDCWAGTARGNLVRVRGALVTDETHTLLSEPCPIRALLATPDNSLWIGFGGMGLGRLKAGQFTHGRREEGLHDDYISQILSDGQGRLWLAGNRGISSLREKNWDELAAGRDTQLQPVVYTQKGGLPGLQASSDAWPNACRDQEGQLYFAMQTGVVTLYPDAIQVDTQPPTVVIDRVLVKGKVVALYGVIEKTRPEAKASSLVELGEAGAELRLPLGRRQVEIFFTVPTFTMPESMRVQYQLLGLEKEWMEAGTRRSVRYSELAPGHYRFQVIACNRDGVWNKQGATLALTIPPFWWETVWFRVVGSLFIVLFACGLIYFSLRRRHQRQLERLEIQQTAEKERARIARDMHDDLGSSLTRIVMLSDQESEPLEQPQAKGCVLSDINQIGRELTVRMSEIVWALNPAHDSLDSFADYIAKRAYEMFEMTKTNFRLDLPLDLPDIPLSSPVRHEVLLAFKEAMHNIVKHAQATNVLITLRVEENAFVLTIKDDGKGFETPPDTLFKGHGLGNMKRRLSEAGGRCEIQAQLGVGTCIRFTVPLGQPPERV
jgi:signal transduction histidine kinase/ligand-binding sensor domain-containing protein